jgi:multidrug efflux system outer membrane protein
MAGLCAMLGGCGLGPAYQPPTMALPVTYTADSPRVGGQNWPEGDWWQQFGLPELDDLIAAARQGNNSVAAAAARVIQADAAVRIAGAPLLPSFSFGPSTSYTHNSPGGRIPSGSLDQRSYALTGGFTGYEVDLWGRLRANRQSAEATALADRFDQQTIILSTVASVATSYFEAVTFQDRLRTARQNLADSEQTLAAIRGRREAGTASDLDVAQQETLVEAERTNIPGLESSLKQIIIGLGILTGKLPEQISLTGGSLVGLALPPLGAGLPSDLLLRRPDVAFAEAALRGANADIRAARAAFFPTLSLSGDGGWQSGVLALLTGPGAAFGTLSAGLTQPIFDNGERSGLLEQAHGRELELVAGYRSAVLQALTDVETALTALRYATDQELQEQRAVVSAQRAEEISRAQLLAGTIDVTTLLSTQTSLYNAEDTLAQLRQARVLSMVNLIKALGGGWTVPATTPGGT